MPEISIIVPVYNVENYIHKCIDSILAQTFTDFQLILVNDGSADRCGEICEDYAGKDNRVEVIHKENGGLSSARNAGLDAARGKYIGFVDSDDYIAADMYSFLHGNITETNADISICSFYTVEPNGRVLHKKPKGIKKYMEKQEALKTLLSRRHFENHVCDKLFRRTLFDDIRFPDQIYEDIAIMYKLFDRCRSVVYVSEPKYFYIQRQGSIVNSGFGVKKLIFIDECQKIVEFSASKGGLYDEEAHSCYILSNLWLLHEGALDKNNQYKEIVNELSKNILSYYDIALKNKYIRFHEKFSIFLLKLGISTCLISRIHAAGKYMKNMVQQFIYRKDIENRNGHEIKNTFCKQVSVSQGRQ